MDKYLLQILLETKTIIIPGLGALTITDEETGEIMFMSYLKYDDGALVKHIAEKENLSENEAKNIVAKYVSEINAKIGQGQDYEMFEFGKFYLKDGEVEFENWKTGDKQNLTESIDAVEEKEVFISEASDDSPVDSDATKSLDEILSDSKVVEDDLKSIEEEERSEPIVEEKILKENSYTPPVKESMVAETPEEVSSEPVVEEVVVERQEDSESIIEFGESEDLKKKPVKKKRKPIFWILIVFIVLLLGISSVTVLFYDQVKQYLPFMENQRTEVERNKSNAEELSEELNESAAVYENDVNETNDEPEIEEPIVEETKVEREPVEPVKSTTPVTNTMNQDGKNYFVICGAFGERANADRLAEKLKSEGNQSSVIGQYDGLYLVAVDSYGTESEANQSLSKYSSITSKAWVFHKR